MPEQGTTGAHRTIDNLPSVPDQALGEIATILGIGDVEQASDLFRHLRAHAQSYLVGKHILTTEFSNRAARDSAIDTSRKIGDALDAIEQMPVMLTGALSMKLDEEARSAGALMRTTAEMRKIKVHLDKVATMKLAKAEANHNLKITLGGLILLLERTVGGKTIAQKRTDFTPEDRLVSPAAQAIGVLLQSVDPSLQITTIVLKILEIQRDARRGTPLEFYAPRLFTGAPVKLV